MIPVRFKLLISLVSLFFLFSCSAPPQETLSLSLLETVNTSICEDDTPVSIIDLFRSFRANYNADHLITVLTKGEEIILTGERGEPGNNTLIYTIGNNRVKVHQTIFVTCDKRRRLFYSLDGTLWYAMKNRRSRGVFNIDYDFPAETLYDSIEGLLLINYQWMAEKSEKAVPVRMKKKSVLYLESDMVFYSKGIKSDTVDLSDYFLRFSKGTELSYNIEFFGNLLSSRNTDTGLAVEIQKDFHIYTTNDSDYKLGISSDGQRWNYRILEFEYNMQESFQADSPISVEYLRKMDISYDE